MNKNIVFIMTDTTSTDMLGCYGNNKMLTPNIDKLAEEGLIFNNAYTCQPVCGPARSALFTGLYPHSNGMIANSQALGKNIKTIGERLGDIKCGYIGKWHLDGTDYFGDGKCPDGYESDYWYDMRCYLEELSIEDRVRSRKPNTSFEISEDFTYAHRCSDRAINFIDNNKGEDYLLVVSYDEPHGPFLCPEPYASMYNEYDLPIKPNFYDDLKDKPLYQRLWAGDNLNKKPEDIDTYFDFRLMMGCNSFVDYEIGRVLKKIEEIIPDALIIFTSDHGDMLGSHKLISKNATVYDEAAKIPFIIKGGDKGSVDFPTSHIDVCPTILNYFGLDIHGSLQGKSILPQITNKNHKIRDYAFIEFTRYEVDHDGFGGLQPMRGIVNENFKLSINLFDKDEFYDLTLDPYEIKNEIDNPKYDKIKNEMHDIILENMNATRDVYRGYQWATRSWRKDKVPTWINDGYTRQRINENTEKKQLDYDTGLPIKEYTRKKDITQ